ncbi:hypothetical protein [Actinomadura sp. WAC 06369]|uniref:hypothetical protein n=1 Tax=Actinomadura sp. WAC 06369 TaxID=2203193 RepID=UPI000F79F389|nr:hypothetical protein [Actinomadura sp. WAC 06369]RSN50856.1 hypothetical protein DMH08_31870 [Actinomadura sp. WAC 06369]
MTTNESAPGDEAGGARDEQRASGNVVSIVRRPGARRFNVADLNDTRPNALRAWASACWHLREHGVTPLPPAHVRRALIRRRWW